jgi:hypothetical protein
MYLKYVATSGSFSMYMSVDNQLDYSEVERGTYTYNGNIVTMTINEINYLLMGGSDVWVSFDELDEDSKVNFGGSTSQFTIENNSITVNGLTLAKK